MSLGPVLIQGVPVIYFWTRSDPAGSFRGVDPPVRATVGSLRLGLVRLPGGGGLGLLGLELSLAMDVAPVHSGNSVRNALYS